MLLSGVAIIDGLPSLGLCNQKFSHQNWRILVKARTTEINYFAIRCYHFTESEAVGSRTDGGRTEHC